MLRFLIKSSFISSSHQNHFKFAAWFHCIILTNMWVLTSWYILLFFSISGVFITIFTILKLWPRKMLWFLIKSCFLSRSNQNHFKFGTCWCLQADIFFDFLHFLVFLSLYLLRKMWPRKSVKVF